MNEYDEQANKFLKETKTEIDIEFLRNGKHFNEDDKERDIYQITLKRGDREYKFNFGNSIHNTENTIKPKPYDVLACLTTTKPETFKDFCENFGYDVDSIKALKTYNKVKDEFNN
jgi:hypothetical protein